MTITRAQLVDLVGEVLHAIGREDLSAAEVSWIRLEPRLVLIEYLSDRGDTEFIRVPVVDKWTSASG